MFRQIKQARKARSLMDDFQSQPEPHDWLHIILFIGLFIAFIGVWFYIKKADKKLESGAINTNNPIINNINANQELDDVIKKYNSIGIINDTQLEY